MRYRLQVPYCVREYVSLAPFRRRRDFALLMMGDIILTLKTVTKPLNNVAYEDALSAIQGVTRNELVQDWQV